MSVPRGYIGLGTTLEYSTDAFDTDINGLARISEIGDVDFGDVAQVEVTGYDTVGRTREYIAGLADPSAIDLTGIFTEASGAEDLETLHGTGDIVNWRITLPDGSVILFDGYVASFAVTLQLDDRIEFSSSLQTSGRPELTIGSP